MASSVVLWLAGHRVSVQNEANMALPQAAGLVSSALAAAVGAGATAAEIIEPASAGTVAAEVEQEQQ